MPGGLAPLRRQGWFALGPLNLTPPVPAGPGAVTAIRAFGS